MAFAEYIVYLFNFAVGAGAVLAFIIIASAGIKIVQSQGEPSKINEAKQKIINCFIGLAVLLTSYILLTTINPDIINIQNINLGNTGITIPIISPVPNINEVTNYIFEEVPLGTIAEGILAGNSSKKNGLPCFEYEDDPTKIQDEDGRIIIGDTIDQNKDNKIDEKDYLLNKDNFYCMKLLDKAIKNKTEIHLKTLTNELNLLLQKNCSCKNCYYPHLLSEPYDCEVSACTPPCVPYKNQTCSNYTQSCGKCESCHYFCGCCGSYEDGCEDAPGWTEENKVNKSCRNPEVINCKRQEIKQLIDGSKIDDYCYEDGHIAWWKEDKDNRIEVDQKLLTYQKSIQRMAFFKQYYIDEVAKLKEAEAKMKDPYGERLSAAELYNNIETKSNVSVTKTPFYNYDISRYCRESNCIDYETDATNPSGYKYDQYGQKVCKKYDFNAKNRVCKMDKDATDLACKEAKGDAEKEACKEYYTYAGDGATFYYSPEYNTDYKGESQVIDQKENKCNVSEQDINKEMYGGLIPIGETVDYTEEWGLEVARVIQTMIDEVTGIASTASSIADFPTQCECSGNCKQEIPISCCYCCSPGGGCCGVACQDNECSTCGAKELYRNSDCSTVSFTYLTGCKDCKTGKISLTSTQPMSRPDYYVCPFKTMCSYVRQIYQVGEINNKCFLPSLTKAEETAKELVRKKIGYLARFEIREKELFDLSGIDVDNGKFTAGAAALFPELDCLIGCDEVISTGLTCESSTAQSIPDRFTLLSMLKSSRERLTGCVKGYGIPYKVNDKVRIGSCYELINSDLTILPDFLYVPKPVDSKGKPLPPYIDCYPYNSKYLNAAQQEICFYNINRTGIESNPGCLMITKEYMDNYYCCQ